MVASINKDKSGAIPAAPMGVVSPPSLLGSPSWDAEQGVWVGSRALSTEESEEVPDPLVIFGYARSAQGPFLVAVNGVAG